MRRTLTVSALLLALRCTPAATAPASTVSADVAVEAPVRYLALGDSFTIGTGSPQAAAFPSRLAARWRSRCAVTLQNPAVNGYTTRRVRDEEVALAGPFAPTLVTFAAGANDIVRGRTIDDYRADVGAVFDALAAHGVPASRVVALPQPDWARSPAAAAFGDAATLHAQIVAFNGALREEAARRGARYVDLFPLMERQAREGLVAGDGLHPSAAAYDAWAAALAEALGEVCAARRRRAHRPHPGRPPSPPALHRAGGRNCHGSEILCARVLLVG